ncbi:MAG TPA: efflux RND transporter permease subunit [Gammaproteobacteria bacterium]|nr:efflux RND transporter permease subunit [Gammaproteobacteria bacterium]
MSLATPFIRRPVATTLFTAGIALAGLFAFPQLPVAPLPQVDIPTIVVQAALPGASPETVAATVAAPLERHLGQIADVTQMTSQSAVGGTRVVLQFGLDRDIDGAARDVEAAINAARVDLPTSLRSNPTYRKANPADAPVLILALTSSTLTQGQLYDAASNVLQQRLAQLDGIGEVDLGGSSLPAVRVELNPTTLAKYGIGMEDVRAALASANANATKGAIEFGGRHYQIYTNDQATKAAQYRDLVVAYRSGAAVHLTDVAEVDDSVENIRNAGLAGGKPAVLVILYRKPGANIIQTVDGVKALLPVLQASVPADIDIHLALDRSTTVRAALHDTELTLGVAVTLVILVVFLFLGDWRAALVPSMAVPISLIGTFAGMYLLGFSLDNLSLMALTISTGFVVDDAIVVLENITRHMEAGMPRREAALKGAQEVSFTVLSISLSLVAVFLPILLMGGIVGRFFREFGVTVSLAIGVSLLVSLTTTPMMCSLILRERRRQPARPRLGARLFAAVHRAYAGTLDSALRHPRLVMLSLLATVVLTVAMFVVIPKGFIPQEDTGLVFGGIQADQSISFQLMEQKFKQFMGILQADPAVGNVVGFTGGRQTNSGFVFVTLKPLADRTLSADQVIARLRGQLAVVAGAKLFLQAAQDFGAGGRQSNAQYQYTLQSDSTAALYEWAPKLAAALQNSAVLKDVYSDQQQGGLETDLVIDRATAARLGVSPSQIDNALYDAFGQRNVSTIYQQQNQYHVVMEVAPQYWQSPDSLKYIYVSTSGGAASGTQSTNAVAGTVSAKTGSAPSADAVAADSARNAASNAIASTGRGAVSNGTPVSTKAETLVPLSVMAHYVPGTTPLAVNHQGQFAASTLSFNLAPGKSLSDAVKALREAEVKIGMPSAIQGGFQGTAQVFVDSLSTEPLLILTALLAVYIVLGVLYESYVHPLTILSTLPSAGVGALLALALCNTPFTIISLIGLILLIGIVKKNAILMIDFAITAERSRNLTPVEAIREACLLRLRPILMTTFAAMLGALPLVLVTGYGSELRQPLGISVIGGLIFSQVLTLYTTPVTYLYLDRLRLKFLKRGAERGGVLPAAAQRQHP